MSTTQTTTETEPEPEDRYTREHTTESNDTDGKTTALAPLGEEKRNQVRLQQLKDATVDEHDDLLELPCSNVSKPDSNESWVVSVVHPFEGELTFHVDSPDTWNRDEELVQLLNWYGLNDDPYHLQFNRDLYVEKNPEEASLTKDWRLVEPPDYTPDVPRPMSEQIRMKVDTYRDWMEKFTGATPNTLDATLLYGVMTLGVLTSIPLRMLDVNVPLFTGVFEALLIQLLPFIAATIIGVTLFDPDS